MLHFFSEVETENERRMYLGNFEKRKFLEKWTIDVGKLVVLLGNHK